MTVQELKKRIDLFLFQKRPLTQLGLLRIILCGTLFYIACWRQLNLDQLGSAALISRDTALQVFPEFYRPMVQWFFWPDSMILYVHLLLIFLLGLITLGLTNRPLMFLAWVINQGVMNRNYSILFGADVIGNLFLFYLAFTNCSDFYSLKNIIFKNKKNDMQLRSDLSSVFYRICQFQICVIYAYTGFEKLKGQSWWQGTALWTVIANPQFSSFDLKFLSHAPWLFAMATLITILFEVYFPAMILQPKLRNTWLAMGVLFHLAIGLLLGLMTFSMVMIATYVLFLNQSEIDAILSYFKTRIPQQKS